MTGGAKHERSGTEARPEARQADGDRWGAAWVRRHRMALGGSRLCSSPSIRGAGDAVALRGFAIEPHRQSARVSGGATHSLPSSRFLSFRLLGSLHGSVFGLGTAVFHRMKGDL